MTRIARHLIFLSCSLLLLGCLFPSGWYNPGIETRLTIQDAPGNMVEQIDATIVIDAKYEYLGERHGPSGETVRDYKKKKFVPTTDLQDPHVLIMVISRPHEIHVLIYHLYGRKDAAVIAELDATSGLLEKRLSTTIRTRAFTY